MSARNSSLRQLPSHSLDLTNVHLEYQPQICLRTGGVLAAEALLRYDDPRYGRVRTHDVLRAAHHLGMLQALTQEVLDLAICDVAAGAVSSLAPRCAWRSTCRARS